MNRALAGELIGCLGVSGSPEEHVRRLGRFSLRDWESSLTWLDLGGIALSLRARLESLGAEDAVPSEVGVRLDRDLINHRRRVAVMTKEFDSINHLFDGAGIEYAVLKGFALIPEYCPDAALRPTYDYDYLLSEDALASAQRLLEAAGYTRKHDGATHHVSYAPFCPEPRPAPSRDDLYSATLQRKVELHLSLWDSKALRIPLRIPEHPLNRRRVRTWQGLRFYSLADEDALVFQILHTFQHILHNWCRLRWFLDIAHFLERRSADVHFWKEFYAPIEPNAPLNEIVSVVLSLAAGLFCAPIPRPIRDHLDLALRRPLLLWVRRYGLRSALDNFAGNKYTLFLYREFLRDEAAWREVRRTRLLPLQRPAHVAGTFAPEIPSRLFGVWRQGWYVARRLIHHSVGFARYAWESARWQRAKTHPR